MKNPTIFNIGMISALLLGALFGFFPLPFTDRFAAIIATLFIRILKLISLPMIFLALVSTLTQMKSIGEAGFLLRKILKYTLLTTLIAATTGMILFFIIQPVESIKIDPSFPSQQHNYFSFLINIIPENVVQPFIDNNVLGIAFIGTVFSIAILNLPQKERTLLHRLFAALFATILKITSILILLMPIGVFAFMIQFIQSIHQEIGQLNKLFLYGICVIAANLIQGLIILPLFLKLKGLSPLNIGKGFLPALSMAFFSKSSNATLPLTLDCAKNRLGISEKIASFSLPLCSIINMNGCAAFIIITLFFVCSSEGIFFTFWKMIPWIFVSTLAAFGNAAIPMGCFFLTTAFLIGMNVPIELMGMILPLYSFFDMIETTLNVWSDGCITTVIDKELSL